MPAATTTTVAPEPPQASWYRPTGDKVMEPFSSPITAAEHKIRNLEKRKLKLDQYKNEQESGKTLNADQLAAVSKYDEVIQQLEHNRELVSCLRQVHQQTIKFIKQEMRREYAERNKFLLSLQAGLDQLQIPTVQQDFLHGENGALQLSEEDIADLNELSKLVKPSLRESDFIGKVDAGAEVVAKLFESRGKINNKPSLQLKLLTDSILISQYFVAAPPSVVPEETVEVPPPQRETPEPVHVPEVPMGISQMNAQITMINQERLQTPESTSSTSSIKYAQLQPVPSNWNWNTTQQWQPKDEWNTNFRWGNDGFHDEWNTSFRWGCEEDRSLECLKAWDRYVERRDDEFKTKSRYLPVIQDRELAYSFMQESQLEIESPHMDPAVVAVSSFAPPQMQQQPEPNHVFTPAPADGMNSIQSGMRDLNLNHLNSNNVEEEEDWEDKITTATFNNSTNVNGNTEGGEDNTNGYDRGGRGSFRGRGGRGRGRGNGYGNSRPPKGSRGGGFNNTRYGNFRADRIGPSESGSGDAPEFRGKGGRGFPRSYRGNGNAPPPAGGPPRRGRGAAKPFNGIHESRTVET